MAQASTLCFAAPCQTVVRAELFADAASVLRAKGFYDTMREALGLKRGSRRPASGRGELAWY